MSRSAPTPLELELAGIERVYADAIRALDDAATAGADDLQAHADALRDLAPLRERCALQWVLAAQRAHAACERQEGPAASAARGLCSELLASLAALLDELIEWAADAERHAAAVRFQQPRVVRVAVSA